MLVEGSNVIFNANAISIYLSGSSATLAVHHWAGWEGTVLTNSTAAITALEAALSGKEYLVDNKLSVADIIIASALSTIPSVVAKSKAVAAYTSRVYNSAAYVAGSSKARAISPPKPLSLPSVETMNVFDAVKALSHYMCVAAVPALNGANWWSQPLMALNSNDKMDHDYQCNESMGLFKLLKSKGVAVAATNPRDFALFLVKHFPSNPMIRYRLHTGLH
jgi:hypothetical protein